jgi:hypothetical protein
MDSSENQCLPFETRAPKPWMDSDQKVNLKAPPLWAGISLKDALVCNRIRAKSTIF